MIVATLCQVSEIGDLLPAQFPGKARKNAKKIQKISNQLLNLALLYRHILIYRFHYQTLHASEQTPKLPF